VSPNLTEAIARSWTIPFWPTLGVLIAAIVYLRGWRVARVTRPRELPLWRALCFLAGLASAWLVLASPLDPLGQFLLVAHMTQHLVLMSVAPPLIVLGAPTVPLLRGLPRVLVRNDLAPWMNSKPFHAMQELFTHPVFAWLVMNVLFVGWHVPAAYELALRNNNWHEVEHGCFFFSALLFWWFVLLPWPSRSSWSRWAVLPFLMTADLVNTAVCAMFVFGGRVVYPTYAAVPRIFDISAMDDQIAAGAEMWVIGSLIFWVPLMLTTLQLLSARRSRRRQPAQPAAKMPEAFDLLRVPVAGSILKSRYGRTGLQVVSLGMITAVIVHGLRGTPLTSMNLAGSMVWNIVRPINLLVFFVAGNLFCMACPFTLPREIARRLGIARFQWPEWLKNKWSAIILMVLFFWAYEQFALWDSPRATALLLLAYIATALLVDSIFRGGNFCKYVCPVGQFNFIASLISPLELGIRSQQVCSDCSTRDCIRGNEKQRGCELQLYLPTKIGNLDCTLCMDCVKACPSDNIGITIKLPARDLIHDPIRASLGRLSSRIDIAVLALLVSFAAIANAGAMIAPIADGFAALQQRDPLLATASASLAFTALLCAAMLLLCIGIAKALQTFSTEKSVRTIFCRFALALLPLGLGMWAGHLCFHLVTAMSSFSPMLQHVYTDFGALLHHGRGGVPGAMPAMSMMADMPGMMPMSKPIDLTVLAGAGGLSLFDLQIWMLNVGLLLSLYAGWRIVKQVAASAKNMAVMLALWGASNAAFYAFCIWVFTQPMEMRGMGM
jgi:cytochrome c oxidase assembly factor CtaG